VLRAIESRRPRLALCGHIHEQWGQQSVIGSTRVINLGPAGAVLDLERPAADASPKTG
jgi:Icc-related predicted phosphoesterase